MTSSHDPVPAADLYCPLMSLPSAFESTLDTIPAEVPYLQPEASRVAQWQSRIGARKEFKVGLVWAGSSREHDARANAVDRRRSLRLSQLAPLAQAGAVAFYSLQKGPPAAEAAAPPAAMTLIDHTADIGDFDDTAALIANLDLVISVDTSVAHLAGALGKPVWILSRFDGCWRWLLEREDSPWYPTARLFRQQSPGDWQPVVARVAAALKEKALAHAQPRPSAPAGAPTPDLELAHFRAGERLFAQGDYAAAAEQFGKALALNAGFVGARNALGTSLRLLGRLDDAEPCFRQVIAARPDLAAPFVNLGNLLMQARRIEDAEAYYRRGLARGPNEPVAHYSLGMLLLLKGDYARGWREYEWRWQVPGLQTGSQRFLQPQWHGEDVAGKTVLLHSEQGLGDSLQFVRYAAPVAARGARVILGCPPELTRVLANADGVTQVVDRPDKAPPFDYHCPLMSLPLALGTTLDTIPAQVPYLHAEPHRIDYWRRKLGTANGLRVGLVWAGSSREHNPQARAIDRRRSLSLSELAPLAAVGGIELFSLQKGAPAAQAAEPPAGMKLVDHTGAINDFSDTAALIANLDLVVSVDTSVAHLAGALGKPVWTLSRFDGCWRWLLEREDSPWYPTARLFRQRRAGNWEPVIERVADALAALARGAGQPRRRRQIVSPPLTSITAPLM